LRRAIQRLLEDELSERLLAGTLEPEQRVRVDLDGRLTFEVRSGGCRGRRSMTPGPSYDRRVRASTHDARARARQMTWSTAVGSALG
jgi:C-terminal, D2-small domain, of ClpB protein